MTTCSVTVSQMQTEPWKPTTNWSQILCPLGLGVLVWNINILREFIFSAARDADLAGYWMWIPQLRVWGHRWTIITYSTSSFVSYLFFLFLELALRTITPWHLLQIHANVCPLIVCILIYLQVFYVVRDSLQKHMYGNCRPKQYLNILTVRQSHTGCQAQNCD